jgi:hypothetical protein
MGSEATKPKVLASLVANVIAQRTKVELDDQETQRFHREFESEVTAQVEAMRNEKRRAYEEAKNISIR